MGSRNTDMGGLPMPSYLLSAFSVAKAKVAWCRSFTRLRNCAKTPRENDTRHLRLLAFMAVSSGIAPDPPDEVYQHSGSMNLPRKDRKVSGDAENGEGAQSSMGAKPGETDIHADKRDKISRDERATIVQIDAESPCVEISAPQKCGKAH